MLIEQEGCVRVCHTYNWWILFPAPLDLKQPCWPDGW